MVKTVGLFIRRDVCFHQPGLLTIFDIHKGFLDAYLPGADRLDLTSLQREAGFESLKQKIFKTCLAVSGNNFNVFAHMDSFYRLSHNFPGFWNNSVSKSAFPGRLRKLNLSFLRLMIESLLVGLENYINYASLILQLNKLYISNCHRNLRFFLIISKFCCPCQTKADTA